MRSLAQGQYPVSAARSWTIAFEVKRVADLKIHARAPALALGQSAVTGATVVVDVESQAHVKDGAALFGFGARESKRNDLVGFCCLRRLAELGQLSRYALFEFHRFNRTVPLFGIGLAVK